MIGLHCQLRERAVRLVGEVRGQYDSEWAAIGSVAAKLGIGSTETLRKRIRKAEVDAGRRPGVTSEESAEVRKLCAGVRELRRANEILRAAALGGLLKHPALIEDYRFSRRLRGRELGPPWDTVDWDADPDWEWHSAAEDDTIEEYARHVGHADLIRESVDGLVGEDPRDVGP